MIEDFDRMSRHVLVGRAVRASIEPPGPVLDIGGWQGGTRVELGGYDVVTADVQPGADLLASVLELPFADNSFAAVVAIDLLEHLPAQSRPDALAEIDRVSSDLIVLAGPFADEAVAEAESRLNEFYRTLTGRPHRWLAEHADYGLPAIGDVVSAFERSGRTISVHGSNPLELWEDLQRYNFVAAELGTPSIELHQALNSAYLDGGDGDPPSYRHIIVASKSGGQLSSLRTASPDSLSTGQARSLIAGAMTQVLRDTRRELQRRDRLESQLRDALDTARQDRQLAGTDLQRTKARLEQARLEADRARRDAEAAVEASEGWRDLKTRLEMELGEAQRQANHYREEAAAQAAKRAEQDERVQRLQTVAAGSKQSLDALSARMRRVAKEIDADTRRLEDSTTWRVGRAVMTPVRILRGGRSTGFDRIRRHLAVLSPATERSETSGASTKKMLASISRDIDRLVASRRVRLGNLIVDALPVPSIRKGERADLRLQRLAPALRAPDATTDQLITSLREAKRELTKLRSSRRYRIGSLLGSVARLGRRRGEFAIDRLETSIPKAVQALASATSAGPARSSAPPVADSVSEHTWGNSRSDDAAELDRLYEEYVANIEPGLHATWDTNDPIDLLVVIDATHISDSSDLALRLHRSIQSCRRAGARVVVVGAPDDVPVPGRRESSVAEAIELADDVGFAMALEPGDTVAPAIRKALASAGADCDAVVLDHDHIDRAMQRTRPAFKPAFSPDLLVEYDYVGRAVAFRSDPYRRHSKNLDLNEPIRDLMLRLGESARPIAKIDGVLVHYGPHAACTANARTSMTEAVAGRIAGPVTVVRKPGVRHLRYEVLGEPLVSVIIPFRDKPDLLETCVESILRLTTWSNLEILLVDNRSEEQATRDLLARWRDDQRIRVIPFDRPFNYSAANNLAAREARGDCLIFLNNDTRLLSPEWIHDLAGHAMRSEIGAVGAKLYYANGRIQHGGVVVGMTGFAGHILAGVHGATVDPVWTRHVRNCTAVTAACLAISKEHFNAVGGFDESFVLTGNDVDLCLRLLDLGLRNIWHPMVELFHYERETRHAVPVPRGDQLLSLERYEPYLSQGDPFYNSQLSRWSTRPVPRIAPEPGIDELRAKVTPEPASSAPPRNPIDGFVRMYDAGPEDLAANAAVMDRFRTNRSVSVKSATWFVPPFDHVYRGGIYTIMRIADGMSRLRGTSHRIVTYGRARVDTDAMYGQISTAFPKLRFELAHVAGEDAIADLPPSDIAVATLWTSAYQLLRFNQTAAKFYLVQDYEPTFQAANAVYALAEQSYRFGFAGIANTPGVADRYRAYGNEAVWFVPGVDRSIFNPDSGRSTDTTPIRIVFYGRPKNDRNGFELGAEALRRVKRQYGDAVEIVSAGAEYDVASYGLEGVLTNLGVLGDLHSVADLYRRSDIGVVFMFTAHPSYQPFEYMASGCATVTNVNESNAWLLRDGENALVTPPTAASVAAAISRLIDEPDLRHSIIDAGLQTVAGFEWEPQIERVIRWIETGDDIL